MGLLGAGLLLRWLRAPRCVGSALLWGERVAVGGARAYSCTPTRDGLEGPARRRSYWRYVRRLVQGTPEPPYPRVCQVGDPALRAVAAPVEPAQLAGPELQRPGGGEARQMEPFPLRVFVNPSLRVLDSRLVTFPEGCESVAGFLACVPRFQAVQISGLDPRGEQVVWQASGWAARIIQHEMDHLQGCLFIDKMDSKTFTNIHWMEVND
nr:PREDICTED: peptide deformylase, mitochondrial [Bos mutus]